MRILVVSNIELDDTNAAGNTFANWLTGWLDTEVSSLYCRTALPHNDFCDSFYRISSISVVKNILTPWKIGEYIKKRDARLQSAERIEGQIINKIKRGGLSFLHVLNDIVISSRIWQNRRYKDYIHSFDPDIVFYFAKSEAFIYQNLKFLKRHTKAKFVAFFADDMYSMYQGRGFKNWIFRQRYPKLIKMSDKNYGASLLMCDTYSKQFGITLSPLYKGCNISSSKNQCNEPIRIVYAGNLFYGRDKTLGKIIEVLQRINSEKQLAFVEIYTNAVITDENKVALNVEGTSKIMGSRRFADIQEILKEADIVLHVESFEPQNIKIVRLSYSTKISDCLESGSMMLVVGPSGIASVEEAKCIDGVVVIDKEDLIEKNIRSVIADPNSIVNRAKQTNVVAKALFPIEVIRKKLHNDFVKLINEK